MGEFQHYGCDVCNKNLKYNVSENVFIANILNHLLCFPIPLMKEFRHQRNINLYMSFLFKMKILFKILFKIPKMTHFWETKYAIGFLWIKCLNQHQKRPTNEKSLHTTNYFHVYVHIYKKYRPLWIWQFWKHVLLDYKKTCT